MDGPPRSTYGNIRRELYVNRIPGTWTWWTEISMTRIIFMQGPISVVVLMACLTLLSQLRRNTNPSPCSVYRVQAKVGSGHIPSMRSNALGRVMQFILFPWYFLCSPGEKCQMKKTPKPRMVDNLIKRRTNLKFLIHQGSSRLASYRENEEGLHDTFRRKRSNCANTRPRPWMLLWSCVSRAHRHPPPYTTSHSLPSPSPLLHHILSNIHSTLVLHYIITRATSESSSRKHHPFLSIVQLLSSYSLSSYSSSLQHDARFRSSGHHLRCDIRDFLR